MVKQWMYNIVKENPLARWFSFEKSVNLMFCEKDRENIR